MFIKDKWYRLIEDREEEFLDAHGNNDRHLDILKDGGGCFKVLIEDAYTITGCDIEFLNQDNNPDADNEFCIEAHEFEFFEEVPETFKEGHTYILDSSSKFGNPDDTVMNQIIRKKINGVPFTVLKIGPSGYDTSTTRVKQVRLHHENGKDEDTYEIILMSYEFKYFFNCAPAAREVRLLDSCRKLDLDHAETHDEYIKESTKNIIQVTGTINIEVDDEASRLWAIQRLNEIRFK